MGLLPPAGQNWPGKPGDKYIYYGELWQGGRGWRTATSNTATLVRITYWWQFDIYTDPALIHIVAISAAGGRPATKLHTDFAMKNMQEALAEQYRNHYARVNVNLDPRSMSKVIQGEMELMYGPFVNNLPQGSRILDLGCGVGFLMYWLAARENISSVGVDSSPSQVEALKNMFPDSEVYLRDGLDFLKENRDSFDGIFCLDVLEHIPGNEKCFEWVQAALEALKPGGFFYCRVPNATNITGSYTRYIDFTHQRSFTPGSMLQLMEAAGFKNCRIVPVKAYHFKGKIRLFLLNLIHRIIFRLCLHAPENQFSIHIHGAGTR